MLCELCPRLCGALRKEDKGSGRCRMPELPTVARAGLHMWEEPPISGTRGSGTVFFSGCSLSCVFCQNEQISHRDFGKTVTVDALREICQNLVEQGAHNLNFVNPTHYAHVLEQLLQTPFSVPAVYNTGGYDRVQTLRGLSGKMDIYLPDLKYLQSAPALRYSGAEDYPAVATRAIEEMVKQVGPCVLEEGLLRRGVIVRHLILPGQLAAAKDVMDWVHQSFGTNTVLFSLMSQYTPWGDLGPYPELSRTLRNSEIRAARDYMQNLGLEGFFQDGQSARKDYTPKFDLTGL